MALREQWAETAMGVVVLALTAGFLTYSLTVGGVHMKRGDYEISAKFGEAGSLAPGAAVTVAGVKVGTVSQITLEPKTYLAVAKLSIDPTVKLPADSTAKITSDGLLGGAHVAIAPGASLDDLKAGGEIENTQGAVDLFGLIGSVIRPQGGAATTATPAAANPATQPAESY
ncbi:outer membrane lipid asymmetry maintenance protein MlaD [Caulobacter vibrioides]|uniref:Outer membrane lipid asymmetry maintenance protein MlaD n=1 Tax=Caulobacter vibrioides TaxID=155892 RepID=A0A290MNT8_CAUVI|nr:outer membrane lipid asymmetry maintenance protein MlaD [Caulobacter vibrioides]ATC33671.1 outer membrane lipid asymmetry maintenance protein MlaD [Caulobacter vibrioides]